MSNSIKKFGNTCNRCGRDLQDSTATYGWKCAEILGTTTHPGQNNNNSGVDNAGLAVYYRSIKPRLDEDEQRYMTDEFYATSNEGIQQARAREMIREVLKKIPIKQQSADEFYATSNEGITESRRRENEIIISSKKKRSNTDFEPLRKFNEKEREKLILDVYNNFAVLGPLESTISQGKPEPIVTKPTTFNPFGTNVDEQRYSTDEFYALSPDTQEGLRRNEANYKIANEISGYIWDSHALPSPIGSVGKMEGSEEIGGNVEDMVKGFNGGIISEEKDGIVNKTQDYLSVSFAGKRIDFAVHGMEYGEQRSVSVKEGGRIIGRITYQKAKDPKGGDGYIVVAPLADMAKYAGMHLHEDLTNPLTGKPVHFMGVSDNRGIESSLLAAALARGQHYNESLEKYPDEDKVTALLNANLQLHSGSDIHTMPLIEIGDISTALLLMAREVPESSEFAHKIIGRIGEIVKARLDSADGVIEGTGKTFSKGSSIPDEVLKTKPKHSPVADKWLNNGGEITIEDGTWKYTNSQGTSVTYKNGYPDFKGSGHVKQEVDIGGFNNRATDFKKADQLAPKPKSPDSSWHHHEDGRTLQEVNRRIHEQFRHKGGISEIK